MIVEVDIRFVRIGCNIEILMWVFSMLVMIGNRELLSWVKMKRKGSVVDLMLGGKSCVFILRVCWWLLVKILIYEIKLGRLGIDSCKEWFEKEF